MKKEKPCENNEFVTPLVGAGGDAYDTCGDAIAYIHC